MVTYMHICVQFVISVRKHLAESIMQNKWKLAVSLAKSITWVINVSQQLAQASG